MATKTSARPRALALGSALAGVAAFFAAWGGLSWNTGSPAPAAQGVLEGVRVPIELTTAANSTGAPNTAPRQAQVTQPKPRTRTRSS
jgi:hypothetical protein